MVKQLQLWMCKRPELNRHIWDCDECSTGLIVGQEDLLELHSIYVLKALLSIDITL